MKNDSIPVLCPEDPHAAVKPPSSGAVFLLFRFGTYLVCRGDRCYCARADAWIPIAQHYGATDFYDRHVALAVARHFLDLPL